MMQEGNVVFQVAGIPSAEYTCYAQSDVLQQQALQAKYWHHEQMLDKLAVPSGFVICFLIAAAVVIHLVRHTYRVDDAVEKTRIEWEGRTDVASAETEAQVAEALLKYDNLPPDLENSAVAIIKREFFPAGEKEG